MEGCPNGPSWVEAESTVDGSMLQGKGWKAFARSRHLTQGQYLSFEYDGDETLSVKIFRTDGGREDCCAESDSSSRSSCYDERMMTKMKRTLSASRPRGARFPEGVGTSP